MPETCVAQLDGNDNTRKANGCWECNKDVQFLKHKHTRGIGDAQNLEYRFRGGNSVRHWGGNMGTSESTPKMWLSCSPHQEKELFLSSDWSSVRQDGICHALCHLPWLLFESSTRVSAWQSVSHTVRFPLSYLEGMELIAKETRLWLKKGRIEIFLAKSPLPFGDTSFLL